MNINRRNSVFGEFKNVYWNLAPPLIMLSSWVGFGVGMIGEINADMNSPIMSFVNIVGHTFIGLASGLCWPIAMPLISICAIYNRSGATKICSK
jgi:hypothetical protein